MAAPGISQLVLVGALIFIQFQSGTSLKLNNDGGYEVLVALDESTPLPSVGANNYINNIKASLRAFSSRLWVATRNHFYLKSVDILVPSHWNNTALIATTQSFQNADIRLSPNTTYPQADNPNVCGQPGRSIQLPSFFFNTTHTGPYGLHWKSLLSTWAMYRFGVHSEHGYIGDTKFPYVTKDAKSNNWTVTGCSNEPIRGIFSDITNPDDTSCASGDSISNNCRFVPFATGQNATTSLMHFHWVESVTEFCDEHTHNVHAQNKHNALCDHKSVWEIIRESPDYVTVTSPRNASVPAVTIRTFKHSASPLLYVLLDRGMVQGSISVAHIIPRLLSSRLLIDENLKNTIASIGAYPGSNTDSPIVELVPWSELGANSNAFLDAVGHLRADGSLDRDFSRALVAVAEKIKAKNHPNGAVALLIKYGADVQNFGKYLAEPEVINAFNEGNIILNSIELNFPNHTGYSHLASVARETGGSYVVLNTAVEAEASVINVLTYVRKTLLTEYTDLRKNWKTLRRENSITSTALSVPAHINGTLQIFVSTSNSNLASANFSVTGNENNGTFLGDLRFYLRRSQDWNEVGSKYTYTMEIPQEQLVGVSLVNLRLSCGSGSSYCVSNVLARTQVKDEAEFMLEVATSLKGDQADLSRDPVTIFAKVTKNGKPVLDAIVIATVTDIQSLHVTTLRLLDDGALAPDAQENDGIYSEYFAPYNDGSFRLSVNVQGNPALNKAKTPKKINERSLTRLLPIDQGDMGCSTGPCESEIIKDSFAETVEISSIFSIVNASSYSPKPTKITLEDIRDMVAVGQVVVSWTSPKIPGRVNTVSSYELRSATSIERLVHNFDNQTIVPVPPNFKPKPPSSKESLTIDRPAVTTYYAVRSVYRGRNSVISNIVSLIILEQGTTTEGGVTNPGTTQTPTSPTVTTVSTIRPTGSTDQGLTSPGTTQTPTSPTVTTVSTIRPTGSTDGGVTSPGITPTGSTDEGETSSGTTYKPEQTTPASASGITSVTYIMSLFFVMICMSM